MPAQPVSFRRLYHDWERDQWAAGGIDFEADGRRRPDLSPVVGSLLDRGSACLALAAEAAPGNLVPMVDGAPTEEQQVFITTQLVDSARQVVLFDLIRERGLVRQGTPTNDLIPQGYRELVLETIPAAAGEIRAHPGDEGRFAAALRLHNVDLEERTLLPLVRLLKRLALRERMPGFAEGLAAVERDLARHAEFARLFLGGRSEP